MGISKEPAPGQQLDDDNTSEVSFMSSTASEVPILHRQEKTSAIPAAATWEVGEPVAATWEAAPEPSGAGDAQPLRLPGRHWGLRLSAGGALALVFCAFLSLSARAPPPAPQAVDLQPVVPFTPQCGPGRCPLRSLFTHPKVQLVATENLMQVGGAVLALEDRPLVEEVVRETLRNISLSLQVNAPMAADELDALQVPEGELGAVLTSLRLLSDSRVQSLGLEVGRAIRASPSPARDYLKTHIEGRLGPMAREIRSLKAGIVTESLRALWGEGAAAEEEPRSHWELALDEYNVLSMETVSGRFESAFIPQEALSPVMKRAAILGGALEEGRVLLYLLQLCVREAGQGSAAALGDTLKFGMGPLSWPCQLDSIPSQDSASDLEKSLLCPLKFGAQGLDALKESA